MYGPRIGVVGCSILAVNSVAGILLYCPIMMVVVRLVHIMYALKYNIYKIIPSEFIDILH